MGVKYKLNESWEKRVRDFGEQKGEPKRLMECFRCEGTGHRARECTKVECYRCRQKGISKENVLRKGGSQMEEGGIKKRRR